VVTCRDSWKELALPKRKSVGQHEEAKGVSESSKPLVLAELAAARGITETELMADYMSSLKLHGEIVEESIGKEFPPWLRKFTEVVASNESRFKAWQELNAKCDVPWLLITLYLFTYRQVSQQAEKKTAAEVFRDSCRFFKEELDRLIQRYSTLHEDTSELFADAKLKPLFLLSDERSALFRQPLNFMGLVLRELKTVRNWAQKMGSLKTEANDLYLYSMARRVREATGEYHFPEITTLVEAALAAHGGIDKEALDHKTLERRVQRFIKR
jgi:hypothetical protein